MNKFALMLLCAAACLANGCRAVPALPSGGTLTVAEIRYAADLTEDEARFAMAIEAQAGGPASLKFLEGDVALLPARLPEGLKIARDGGGYMLVAQRAGRYRFSLDAVVKIQRDEPWNHVAFTGPAATIASITARALGTNTEVQLSSGTLLSALKTNGCSSLQGFLGSDQVVSLRWQGRVAAVARKALLTVDSDIAALVTPGVVKYTSRFHYDIVQGNVARLTLSLPSTQALTRLEGVQIRDWHTTVEGVRQLLTIDFIKPLEGVCDLVLHSEQAPENSACDLLPPQPLGVERETGGLTVIAEDTLAETVAATGLRQVNAPGHALAAYRFNARPFSLALRLKRIEPVITVADRVDARIEESRLVVVHRLSLNVEKSGIYGLELAPPAGYTVADLRGAGIEDWTLGEGKVAVNFSARVLGERQVSVHLEQALKIFPPRIAIAPVRVAGAARETAQIGVAAVPGIRLKTDAISGLRETPVSQLAVPSDEILAYTAEQPDWQLGIGCEKLSARIMAEIFNLVTIGDGAVGGSATIRYGLVNQGVQQFKVRVPAGCKNVDFTGPNIRRKEVLADPAGTNDVLWCIGLQDKAWDAYTLVVTYDHPFDSKGAVLSVGGVHAVDVERETGSIAITTAASLQLEARKISGMLRRVDESELSMADRALVTRAVVLAWQYTGGQYALDVDVKRYAEERVLEAVADRTQITSVLTGGGEMLTQASFMVKNNEKQFQRFQLPRDSRLWGCYVNGLPSKPALDGDWVLVSLPREVNRDQAFAVDIMYAQTNGALASKFGRSMEFHAPRTDVPNTYAEWQLFVPPGLRLSSFGGSMNVTDGTTYELLDAWKKFIDFYGQVLREAGAAMLVIGFLAVLVLALVISAVRRGWNGVITLLGVFAILAVLGAMLLPALSSAKKKAQRISSANNLKQIGLAARIFSGDNNERLPASFEEMKNELGTDQITYDPATGQRYTYLGAGLSLDKLKPDSVLAYSAPDDKGRCSVLFADGSVQMMGARDFAALSQRGLVQLATTGGLAQQQFEAVDRAQMSPAAKPAAPPAPVQSMDMQGEGFPASGMGGSGPSATVTGAVLQDGPAPAAVAAGIRSIRIELPQTGQPYLFTKVLNVHGEPLTIRAHVQPMQTFQTLQMIWQTAAFIVGLLVWWRQWRRPQRNTFILVLALMLILGSVGSLLIQWRALHDVLIIGLPVAGVALAAFLIWKYWPRNNPEGSSDGPDGDAAGVPPTLAVAILAFSLATGALSAAPAELKPEVPAASIVSAEYSGTVNDRVALIEATFQFADARAGKILPLFGGDVTAQEYTARQGGVSLVREGATLAARFDRDGAAILQVKLLVKVSGDVTKRQLAFAIPAALSVRMALALDQSEADVEFPAAISLKRTSGNNRTRVEAVLGSVSRVEILWTPRVKRAEEVTATVFCQNASLVSFGGGAVNTRATLDYQVTQGELRQARVQLPPGHRLLRVEGREIRTWEIRNENGAQILMVDLLKGVTLSWRLAVETEKILDALPAAESVAIPRALDVKRENGLVALRGAEELSLIVAGSAGLERVDAEEFSRASGEKSGGLVSAFRFAAPDFSLRLRVEAVQPQIETVVRSHFRVGPERVNLSASVNHVIKRAGVFTLRTILPQGWTVERVTGSGIQQWTEKGDDIRVLEVTLKDRTIGAYVLGLELSRSFKELPKSLALAGVHPLGAAKLSGYVTVSTEPGVAARTSAFEGLTEIPADAVDARAGQTGGLLAFKFISAQPGPLPEWALTVETEIVAAWVRAEVINTFTLSEALVSGRAVVRYDIANAPVKELRLRVPEGCRNVEISGSNIRSRISEENVWRVELQSPVRGNHSLNVTWEQTQTVKSKTNAVELAGVSALNVERETGYYAVCVKAPLQAGEMSAEDLQRVDAADLPVWGGVPAGSATLAYHYSRPGARLALDVRRFDDAAVLEALVDRAQLTSVVADDGQMMTELSLTVRNNGRQFLEISLPPDARVWSAFVGGQPVRPSVRNGKHLLPIETSGANEAVSVELTYVGTNLFPRTSGEMGFASPRFDVPLKNARWDVYLPPDYDYADLKQGTMTREAGAKPEPYSANFSILDYSRMEQQNKATAKVEARRDVSEARQQLSVGNVREATANYNRAKSKASAGKDGEMEKLADELKIAQASNLIGAQNDFYLRNNGALGFDGDINGLPKRRVSAANDTAAAGEQWVKLQQAQEIVTSKVQPLRVNLPVRGQRITFTQVLQTEGGKPMTFRLASASTRAVHWPSRLAGGAGAFLLLWGGVILMVRLTRRKP